MILMQREFDFWYPFDVWVGALPLAQQHTGQLPGGLEPAVTLLGSWPVQWVLPGAYAERVWCPSVTKQLVRVRRMQL